MDKTLVCGTGTSGSTPGESTKLRRPLGRFNFVLERNRRFRPGVEKSEFIAHSEARTIRAAGSRRLVSFGA